MKSTDSAYMGATLQIVHYLGAVWIKNMFGPRRLFQTLSVQLMDGGAHSPPTFLLHHPDHPPTSIFVVTLTFHMYCSHCQHIVFSILYQTDLEWPLFSLNDMGLTFKWCDLYIYKINSLQVLHVRTDSSTASTPRRPFSGLPVQFQSTRWAPTPTPPSPTPAL